MASETYAHQGRLLETNAGGYETLTAPNALENKQGGQIGRGGAGRGGENLSSRGGGEEADVQGGYPGGHVVEHIVAVPPLLHHLPLLYKLVDLRGTRSTPHSAPPARLLRFLTDAVD